MVGGGGGVTLLLKQGPYQYSYTVYGNQKARKIFQGEGSSHQLILQGGGGQISCRGGSLYTYDNL